MNRVLLLYVIASFVYLTPITAENQSDLRSTLEGRYAELKSAIANRDAESLSSLLTPDFISTDISGRAETAAQMISDLKKLPVRRPKDKQDRDTNHQAQRQHGSRRAII